MNNPEETYVCPMHPEIVSETPGKCSICGMRLVKKDEVKDEAVTTEDVGLGEITLKSYLPLAIIALLILVSSLVAALGTDAFVVNALLYFMTGFFLVFAGFKLLDLKGFAEGYSTYDLLAQRWYGYGYVYPFIELSFGLVMLAGFHDAWLLYTEAALMLFSGLGVSLKIYRGEKFQCACLGTFLKVPLTYVTLVEDFGMVAIALILIGLL